LAAALEDSDSTVRRQAATALGRIGSAGKSAIQALQRTEKDPAPIVREAAAEAVRALKEAP
jgi:HEAT repeat protein